MSEHVWKPLPTFAQGVASTVLPPFLWSATYTQVAVAPGVAAVGRTVEQTWTQTLPLFAIGLIVGGTIISALVALFLEDQSTPRSNYPIGIVTAWHGVGALPLGYLLAFGSALLGFAWSALLAAMGSAAMILVLRDGTLQRNIAVD